MAEGTLEYQLKEIMHWGRSFEEYVDMFALSDDDLTKSFLGCGDGPASFNSELTRRGGKVVSVDPFYADEVNDISRRIDEIYDRVIWKACKSKSEFLRKHIRSINELLEVRMQTMRDFLSDFPQGRADGRYLPESAPILSFPDNSFDISVCSHFLFLYSGRLDLSFHMDAITEMCRVSGEARIFPLFQLSAVLSPHVQPVCDHFETKGYEVTKVQVPYKFSRGGNEMLRIRKVMG